jgi:hypothetical protein
MFINFNQKKKLHLLQHLQQPEQPLEQEQQALL